MIIGTSTTDGAAPGNAARPAPLSSAAAQPLPDVTASTAPTISPAAAALNIHSHASHDCLRFRSVLLQPVPFGQ